MPENLEVDEKVTTFAHVNETSRDGAEVARWAHNPKVVCSSQASATKLKVISLRYDLFCLCTPYIFRYIKLLTMDLPIWQLPT